MRNISSFIKQSTYILAALFFGILAFPENVFAYVDPGIGGLIFQIGYILLTVIIITVTFFLKTLKKVIKKIIKYIIGRDD